MPLDSAFADAGLPSRTTGESSAWAGRDTRYDPDFDADGAQTVVCIARHFGLPTPPLLVGADSTG